MRQRNICHRINRILTVRIVRKCNRHVTIQEREQRRRVSRIFRPVGAEGGSVWVEVVSKVDKGVEELARIGAIDVLDVAAVVLCGVSVRFGTSKDV